MQDLRNPSKNLEDNLQHLKQQLGSMSSGGGHLKSNDSSVCKS